MGTEGDAKTLFLLSFLLGFGSLAGSGIRAMEGQSLDCPIKYNTSSTAKKGSMSQHLYKVGDFLDGSYVRSLLCLLKFGGGATAGKTGGELLPPGPRSYLQHVY